MHTLRIRHVNCCSFVWQVWQWAGGGVEGQGKGHSLHAVNVLTTCTVKVSPPFGSFWLRCNFIKIK